MVQGVDHHGAGGGAGSGQYLGLDLPPSTQLPYCPPYLCTALDLPWSKCRACNDLYLHFSVLLVLQTGLDCCFVGLLVEKHMFTTAFSSLFP